MTPEQLQRLERIEAFIGHILKADRFYFDRHFQFKDGVNIQAATGTGTKIGTASTQKFGFYGVTPVAQFSNPTGRSDTGADTGTTAHLGTTYTGNTGSSAYSVGDIVNALKTLGLIA